MGACYAALSSFVTRKSVCGGEREGIYLEVENLWEMPFMPFLCRVYRYHFPKLHSNNIWLVYSCRCLWLINSKMENFHSNWKTKISTSNFLLCITSGNMNFTIWRWYYVTQNQKENYAKTYILFAESLERMLWQRTSNYLDWNLIHIVRALLVASFEGLVSLEVQNNPGNRSNGCC